MSAKQPNLKLISLNIERDNHYSRFIPFLLKEDPDIVCLQEVFSSDLQNLEQNLGMKGYFAPMTKYDNGDSVEAWGVAIFSKKTLTNIVKDYYVTDNRLPGEITMFDKGNLDSMQKVLLSCSIISDGYEFRVANTHFTWSPKGQADESQRRDIGPLLHSLSKFKDIVFCGDFNAPRGREIYTQLSSHYKDNVPNNIKTTLDQELHRMKGLNYVVDSIFSSQNYAVKNVRVVSGVSDHCALVGIISKESVVTEPSIFQAKDELVLS